MEDQDATAIDLDDVVKTVVGSAFAGKHSSPFGLFFGTQSSTPTVDAEVAAILSRSRSIVNSIGGVTIPLDVGNRNNPEDRPVRKMTFGADGDETRRMAPDPLLLAVKAAVSWSKRHEQQLLAGEQRPEEDIDRLSLLEEEMHAQRMDEACRPKTS